MSARISTLTALRWAACVCAAAACVLAFVSAPAYATLTHNYISSFGLFNNVQGIAVEESTGDVLVYDQGAGTISKFNAAGEPAEFSALKTDVIEGVIGGNTQQEIAVDNSCFLKKLSGSACEQTDPANGDIYITTNPTGSSDYENVELAIYSATGSLLGYLKPESHGHGSSGIAPCGVAVDPAGRVYVGLYEDRVDMYTPTVNPITNGDYTSSLILESDKVCNVAVDAKGDVYGDDYEGAEYQSSKRRSSAFR